MCFSTCTSAGHYYCSQHEIAISSAYTKHLHAITLLFALFVVAHVQQAGGIVLGTSVPSPATQQ